MTLNTIHFKEKLDEEKKLLIEELSQIAHPDAENKGKWVANTPDLNVQSADKNEMSDTLEEFGNIAAVEQELEKRLGDVEKALECIKKGTYGKCEADNKEIPEERLEANPAATTCMEHSNNNNNNGS